MSGLIESFQQLDGHLIKSISSSISPVVLIEDIETGSLKAWLSYFLEAVDDEAIKNLDWKPAVGRYLVKAKYIILDFIKGRATITDRKEISQLEKSLLDAAQDTEVLRLPCYNEIDTFGLLKDLSSVTNALQGLNERDSVYFLSDTEPDIIMNSSFKILPETIEDLVTRETLSSKSVMILKVKKPDYLGDSKWEFRHESKVLNVKIQSSAKCCVIWFPRIWAAV